MPRGRCLRGSSCGNSGDKSNSTFPTVPGLAGFDSQGCLSVVVLSRRGAEHAKNAEKIDNCRAHKPRYAVFVYPCFWSPSRSVAFPILKSSALFACSAPLREKTNNAESARAIQSRNGNKGRLPPQRSRRRIQRLIGMPSTTSSVTKPWARASAGTSKRCQASMKGSCTMRTSIRK